MSLSNAAVSLDCSDNISIATTSTTSTPIEKEEAPIVAPPKSPSLLSSLLPPPSPLLLSQPEEKQPPLLDSENPLSSPEHPDKPEETEQEQGQEDNKRQKGKEAERAEHHETGSIKYSGATESPLEALNPKEQVISLDFQDTPLIADDEVDDEEGEYDLSITLEEMAQMSKIRGRDREPQPGAKRVLKRVRVRKDTSSSKRRTKKHNLRVTMNSAVIAEKLAAERGERGERSGEKEIKKEKKKERLAAVVEWKPIVEPVSKPRVRPSGLRFSENCYSDPEDDDEGQGSEQTGHKRKREDHDLGDEDEDESLGGSADISEVPEKRQHQSHPEIQY